MTQTRKHSKFKFFAYLAFVLLLILSPCKVRNFLQSQLEIQQTEVTNKSQSTFSSFSCLYTDQVLELPSNSEIDEISIPLDCSFAFTYFTLNSKSSSSSFINPNSPTSRDVPFYILYQNFKAFIA